MQPNKCPAKEKEWGEKSKRKGKERKLKEKAEILYSVHVQTTQANILHKLIFCIWIRRLRSVQPVKGFVLSFSSLYRKWPENGLSNFKTRFLG